MRLSFNQFSSIIRAADPNRTSHDVAQIYRSCQQAQAAAGGAVDGQVRVSKLFFVRGCQRAGLMTARAWNTSKFGMRTIGPTQSFLYHDTEQSIRLLRHAWSLSENGLRRDIASMEKGADSPETSAEVTRIKQRLGKFLDYYSDVDDDRGPGGATGQNRDAERMWQSYRLLMYEYDRLKRTKQMTNSMAGLMTVMRFKRRLKMKAGVGGAGGEGGGEGEGAGPSKVGGLAFLSRIRRTVSEGQRVEHPIYSKVRWGRVQEALLLLDSGFKIDTPDSHGGNTILHIAAQVRWM